jgi:hypothetical protein
MAVGEIKFTELVTGGAIQDSDIFPSVQLGNNVKQPALAVAAYVAQFGSVGGTYIAPLTIIGGLTNVTFLSATYSGNTSLPGGIITANVKFMGTTNANMGSDLCILGIGLPIVPNFTGSDDIAQISGAPSIVKEHGVPVNNGSGWPNDLQANSANQTVTFLYEASENNTQYILDVTFTYQLKAP